MKKISVILFSALLFAIIAVNVAIVIQDGKMNDYFFSDIEAMAQGESTSFWDRFNPHGPTESRDVTCTKTTTISSSNGNSNNSNWNGGGSVSGGNQFIGGNINGGYNNGNSNNNSSATTITITSSYTARKYFCPGQNDTSCTPYDPCN